MRFFKSRRIQVSDIEIELKSISDPETGAPVTESGRIDSVVVTDAGDVTIAVLGARETLEQDERVRYEIEQVAKAVKGVGEVRVLLTSHSTTAAPSKPVSAAPSKAATPAKLAQNAGSGALTIPGVKSIIAVASAKGGVGKSTVALNLAVALSRRGLKVGVLDADVYGPSVPTMTGTAESHPGQGEGGKLIPIEAFGLKLMSIGYISDIDAPMIWRGPIVMSALTQMMKDVIWGELDILIIDTPPGTGDAQLTLAQRISLDGAVIVSTPQEVALADVRRGVAMFRKTHVPVLGVVENMAYFEDPVSQNRTFLFGEGGARRMAETLDVPFLGELALIPAIREGGDTGKPVALGEGSAAEAFLSLADAVSREMATASGRRLPEIVFE